MLRRKLSQAGLFAPPQPPPVGVRKAPVQVTCVAVSDTVPEGGVAAIAAWTVKNSMSATMDPESLRAIVSVAFIMGALPLPLSAEPRGGSVTRHSGRRDLNNP